METKKEFCILCNQETEHSFSPGMKLWLCDVKHTNPCGRCSKCGEKVSEDTRYVAAGLGASHVVCKKCRTGGGIKDISKTQPIIRDISRKKEE